MAVIAVFNNVNIPFAFLTQQRRLPIKQKSSKKLVEQDFIAPLQIGPDLVSYYYSDVLWTIET